MMYECIRVYQYVTLFSNNVSSHYFQESPGPVSAGEDASSLNTLQITHVTSMNPKATFTPYSQCRICGTITNLRCLGCNRDYYCSNMCQVDRVFYYRYEQLNYALYRIKKSLLSKPLIIFLICFRMLTGTTIKRLAIKVHSQYSLLKISL